MGFFKALFAIAAFGFVAFLGLTWMGMTAMSDYGATHDMTVDVPLEEVLLLNPMTSFTELCEGERHESWDVVCNAPSKGMVRITDMRAWMLDHLEN